MTTLFDGSPTEAEVLVSFNFKRQTMMMVQAGRGTGFEVVMRCAVRDLGERYGYKARARLAEEAERPGSWAQNPLLRDGHEVWLLVAVWEMWDEAYLPVGRMVEFSVEEAVG